MINVLRESEYIIAKKERNYNIIVLVV